MSDPSEPQATKRETSDLSLFQRWGRAGRDVLRDLKENENGPRMDWRTVTILLLTPILLTIFYYWGRPDFFRRNLLGWAQEVFGAEFEFHGILPYAYWSASSLILRVIIPLGVVLLLFREHPRDYGWRLKGSGSHIPIYLALFLVMLPILYIASTTDAFQSKYPFYDGASQMGWHFWGYELSYFLQFFALEAFFRGFLIFGLYKRFGYYSVIIMTIPYCMIHFNKPVTETMGAIFAGILLGVLALRSGSFLLGVLLHFAVALTLDLLALWHSGALG